MRRPVGTVSRNPIIVRCFEALERPGPGFERVRVGRLVQRIRPVRVARLGFKHSGPLLGMNWHSNSPTQDYEFLMLVSKWFNLVSRGYETNAQPTRKLPCVVR